MCKGGGGDTFMSCKFRVWEPQLPCAVDTHEKVSMMLKPCRAACSARRPAWRCLAAGAAFSTCESQTTVAADYCSIPNSADLMPVKSLERPASIAVS